MWAAAQLAFARRLSDALGALAAAGSFRHARYEERVPLAEPVDGVRARGGDGVEAMGGARGDARARGERGGGEVAREVDVVE